MELEARIEKKHDRDCMERVRENREDISRKVVLVQEGSAKIENNEHVIRAMCFDEISSLNGIEARRSICDSLLAILSNRPELSAEPLATLASLARKRIQEIKKEHADKARALQESEEREGGVAGIMGGIGIAQNIKEQVKAIGRKLALLLHPDAANGLLQMISRLENPEEREALKETVEDLFIKYQESYSAEDQSSLELLLIHVEKLRDDLNLGQPLFSPMDLAECEEELKRLCKLRDKLDGKIAEIVNNPAYIYPDLKRIKKMKDGYLKEIEEQKSILEERMNEMTRYFSRSAVEIFLEYAFDDDVGAQP